MSEVTPFGSLAGGSYQEIRSNFVWNLPRSYNIAEDCCDRHPPDDLALIYDSDDGAVQTYSFGDLSRASNRLANALEGIGIQRGDRVGIVLPQRPETAITHLAAYKMGAVALPLSGLFGPDALSFRLQDSGARAVIVDRTGADKIEEIGDCDLEVVVVDDTPRPGTRGFWDVLGQGAVEHSRAPTSPDDPALLIYTSGTTGPPKGALHAHRVLLGHLPGFVLSHEFFPQPDDRAWTPADWAWIGGLIDILLPSWHFGIPVVAASRRGFDPDWAWDLIERQEIRNVFLPPTALKMLRAAPPPHAAQLRTVMSGGEALGEEILHWARDLLGVTINEIYGQTEVNYVVGNCAPVWEVRPGSMGLSYPGHGVEVVDDEGHPLPPGTSGEIAVRSPDPVMFLEYWRRPEATREKFAGPWALTGDTAVRDEDGYLWFGGRKDDVITSAGYRIGPGEIEDCLLRHDAVALAAAIGVPDESRGEVVKAFVVLRKGVEPCAALEEDIRRHVRERLAAYQYPRVVEFVTDLPMTTTGKIRRAELRNKEAERSDRSRRPL